MMATLCALLWAAPGAVAGEVSAGFGLGIGTDMPDKVSKDYANFGPGPGLLIPLWWELGSAARLRATARADMAMGSDRVTWAAGAVDGSDVRLYDDDHLAVLVAASLTVGGEVVIPGSGVAPYLGAELGPAWIGTYHSLDGATATALLDPEQNELDNPGNIDPYTGQVAWRSDVHLGVQPSIGDTSSAWLELGYSLAFVGEKALRKTPEDIDARRAPYGYNAIRLGVGLAFEL